MRALAVLLLLAGCTVTRPPADGEAQILVCIFAHCEVLPIKRNGEKPCVRAPESEPSG